MVLMEDLEIENGVIVSNNFDIYFMLCMCDVFINIWIYFDVMLGYEWINEIGELLVGFVGFVIGNVIFQVIGKWVWEFLF